MASVRTEQAGSRAHRRAQDPNVPVVEFRDVSKVYGGGSVGLDGASMRIARGEFVFHTDSDRQHTPDDFWSFWEQRAAADFVFGIRDHRADGALRSGISATMRVVNFVLWGCWIADANCPYKLMRRSALEQVLSVIPSASFIPMVMVSVLARRAGFRVSETQVRHFPRIAGQQSLRGLVKWLHVGRRCVGELVALRAAERKPTMTLLPYAIPIAVGSISYFMWLGLLS